MVPLELTGKYASCPTFGGVHSDEEEDVESCNIYVEKAFSCPTFGTKEKELIHLLDSSTDVVGDRIGLEGVRNHSSVSHMDNGGQYKHHSHDIPRIDYGNTGSALPYRRSSHPQRQQQHQSNLLYTVQFKSTTDTFSLSPVCPSRICVGDYVKVEADRGYDIGRVSEIYSEVMGISFAKKILSLASETELQHSKAKVEDERIATEVCRNLVARRGLRIAIVDSEYQFDRKKLTFFFTSERHTDFRELVRDLFATFKTRIWMQKIKSHEAGALLRRPSTHSVPADVSHNPIPASLLLRPHNHHQHGMQLPVAPMDRIVARRSSSHHSSPAAFPVGLPKSTQQTYQEHQFSSFAHVFKESAKEASVFDNTAMSTLSVAAEPYVFRGPSTPSQSFPPSPLL
eukprot:CAMPEP_0185025948 /NCGR_PEP_ID=MMETSP1103-20130426/9475_1 /TAXON_ID=36769 /ORGANISM="Paraphysomonas bandaiensis, Strain Caron Lab Isolate" /LENGTH=397 /DNA_ID=CAMNT_0027559343 /DNA_START=188 /DNA_END=1381 /DNA_ORIENTATION=-